MISLQHHYGVNKVSQSTPIWRMAQSHRIGAIRGVASVNNIQALRESKGWSRPKLGVRMGTSGQQIERLEKGQRNLTQDWIDRAADALGVTPAEIISPLSDSPGIESDHAPTKAADAGDAVEIIQLDLSLPMGPGATVEDYIEQEPRLFDLAYIRSFTRTSPSKLRLARGVGDSMWPTLQSYDQVWIDSSQRRLNQSDRVWAVSINGAAAIKRLRPIKGGRVLVISDNPGPGHDNYEVDAGEILIGGRVIRFSRDI